MTKAQPVTNQPFVYPLSRSFIEPDWHRIPGYRTVTQQEWESAVWQRKNSIKNLRELKEALGDKLDDVLMASIARDQQERATMSMLIPPQMINTMDVDNLLDDPVRKYMIPAFSDRVPDVPSHPMAHRDSLHEAEMWVVEGLTHRYPTKVLAEILSTCPQYCGHCTRMDLVGKDVPQVTKLKFQIKQKDRYEQMLTYLENTPSVRDVVVSGGDIANTPIRTLEALISRMAEIPHIRDIRLATKGLMGIPQHFLQDEVLQGVERMVKHAKKHGTRICIHTHINHANQVTPLVAKAAQKLLELGLRDIRNQGVLLRGVNTTPNDLLELSFVMLDHADIMSYYFYMCDMIPHAEHWRLALWEAQNLQTAIMGFLPGFATPRIVCDVPLVGKRWVHQVVDYDRVEGISYWSKNYLTSIETDPAELAKLFAYYDPIYTLPQEGQRLWQQQLTITR